MKAVQLTSKLRYVPLSDEEGKFGLFIVHDGDRVQYTIEVKDGREFEAALESFQTSPVGVDLF